MAISTSVKLKALKKQNCNFKVKKKKNQSAIESLNIVNIKTPPTPS